MFTQSPVVERLLESFRRLPGVGRKSAERYAMYLLTQPPETAHEFSDALRDARDRITWCPICRNLTDVVPCMICADERRDHGTVCVVEQPASAMAIEKGGSYRGVYHVLHGVLNPLEGIGPDELQLDLLAKRISDGRVHELIVATNTTAEGEATALYVARRLGAMGVRVTRIAHGVPMGGGIEYADDVTLAHAIEGRAPI